MSLPGVESARRRRASYGRSSSTGSSQLPALRLKKLVPAAFRLLGAAGHHHEDRDGLQGRAMAARNRLDQRLRVLAPSTTCTNTSRYVLAPSSTTCTNTSRYSRERAGSPSIMGHPPVLLLRQGSEDSISKRNSDLRLLREERLPAADVVGGGGRHEDCPICLDSFSSGQMVIYLPCQHRYHSDCLVPWLQHHCHCPFCRAKIACCDDSPPPRWLSKF